MGNGLEFQGSGIRRSALTGDVTASAGSNDTTIANNVITNAKLANMATATIKGRTTAGTGDPEDLTAAQALALIGAATSTTVAAQIAAAELTPAQIMSKAGEQLIAAFQQQLASNAGTACFATASGRATTFTIRTTTGYARLVNSDNTVGTRFGTGVPGAYFSVSIPASPSHRAFGVISVTTSSGLNRSGNITHLSLTALSITNFSGTSLTGLIELNLQNNRLTTFSPPASSALTYLNLSGNQLTAFSGTSLSSLTNLNLSGNQLTTFSGAGLSSLTYLTLSGNQLTTFSGTGLSGLRSLYLSGNQLTTFSGAGLSALTYLNLQNNQLTTFSGTGLSSLSELNLAVNQLTTFSGTGLSSLEYLILWSNQLTTFSGEGLSSLFGLNLESNQLTTFSGAGLSALTELSLYSNQLTTFSGEGLAALIYLIINDNQLTSVDMADVVLGASDGSDFSSNLLNGAALNAFYTSLGVDLGATGIINVTGNPGTATDNPAIATAKGYTIIGT